MVKLTEASIESDHDHWCDDFATWIRDIDHWQGHHDAVLTELRQLYLAVKSLKSAAAAHADAIANYEDLCHRHAAAVARGAEDRQCAAMTFVHSQMAARHGHIKGDHERIKGHHDSVLSRLRNLVNSIGGPDKEGDLCTPSE